MTILIALTVGISTCLAAYWLIYTRVYNDRIEERLRYYFKAETDKKASKRKLRRGKLDRRAMNAFAGLAKMVKTLKVGGRYGRHVQREALRAGLLWRGEEIMALQMTLGALAGGLGYAASGNGSAALLAFAAGAGAPLMVIRRMKRKRGKAFDEQLGDSIALISNSLRAGHSFLQAVDAVVREMPDPMASEFGKLLKEMRLGVQTEEALHNLLDRVQSRDLELLVTAILIQRQSGGNLSGILDQITTTIRDRVKIKGEVKAITAQGRLSGIVVALLPFVLGLAIFFIDRDYILLLFDNPLGNLMLAAALVSVAFGYMVIQKIVKIEL